MFVPFASFQPDMPATLAGANAAFNVIPVRGGYKGFADLATLATNALTARCQGAAAFIASDGNVYFFAGDATKLYLLTAPNTTFSDVSGATYTTAAEERWSFYQHGDYCIALNYADPPQKFLMGTDAAFSDLNTSDAPKARYGCVAKNFAIHGNVSHASYGALPDTVWWSKQGDVTTWPTPGSAAAIAALSDKRQLAGDGGWVMGLVPGLTGADFAVIQERQIVRAIFGGDQIWNFDAVEGAKGTPAAGSIVQEGGRAFYWAEFGIYETNGVASTPISVAKVEKFLADDSTYGVDDAYIFRVSGVRDPTEKAIYWAYPSVSGASDGSCDKVLVYSYDVGEFAIVKDLEAVELLAQVYTLGYTLEQLDAFGDLDSLPFSLDSRFWQGGQRVISAFNTSHTLKGFTGDDLAARLTTVERTIGNGVRMQVNGARPVIEGTSCTPTITPIKREKTDVAPTTGSAVSRQSSGVCKFRSSARYLRLQMDIAAGGDWDVASGIEIPDDMIVAKGGR